MPRPCKLTFDLLTLKMVSESRVTWPTSVPIIVFLGLSVIDLGPMYASDFRRQTDVRRASSLNAPYPRGWSIINGRGRFVLSIRANYGRFRDFNSERGANCSEVAYERSMDQSDRSE